MRNDFESNYLMHHGILGQKWGVRRYQNDDGSLTEAGRKRYGVGEGKSVSDISTEKGYNRRVKDLNKAIKKNEKKRGKEYTKIANNPENFLGSNKKHAKKIEEYSENIKKGKNELKELADKKGSIRTKADQKQLSKEVAKSVKKNGWNNNNDAREKINSAISKEQKDTLRKKYKAWNDEFEKEEKFYESSEYKKAHDNAYDDTLKWYKKNEPDQLNAWVKDNGGRTSGLAAYHDFRKTYEGFDDEYTSKAQESWNKSHGVDENKQHQAQKAFYSYADEVTKSLVGKYGNMKVDKNQYTNQNINLNKYVRDSMTSSVMLDYYKKK